MNHVESTQLMAMHDFLVCRREEILGSICKLVEIESPSGDFEGSRALVELLVVTTHTMLNSGNSRSVDLRMVTLSPHLMSQYSTASGRMAMVRTPHTNTS
jgi:hypothetical protein